MKLSHAALVIFVIAASPRLARANAAPVLFRGERHGLLVPRTSTNIHIEREELSFDVPKDLSPANVTATYTMRADARERASIAFVFVRAHFGGAGDSLRIEASVTMDGIPIDARLTSDGELLDPKLRAWVDERPDVARALRAASDAGARSEEAARIMRALGGACSEGCPELVEWSSMSREAPREIRYERALRAAHEVIPHEVEAIHRGWSTLAETRELGFLIFDADMDRDRPRVITVRYEHRATRDSREYVNGQYLFEYLLSPASRWASFGPLDVTIRVPDDVVFSSPLPFARDPSTGAHRASFASLPPSELTFSLTSTRGLWLGLARHRWYWAILGAAIATAAGLASAAVGLVSARRRAGQRVLVAAMMGAVVALVAAFAAHALLRSALPRHALFFDSYNEDPPSSVWMVEAAVPLGAVVAVIACVVRSLRDRRRGG